MYAPYNPRRGDVKFRAPRTSALDAARRVDDRRKLMLEIRRGIPPVRPPGYGQRSGRSRLLEHKTFDFNSSGAPVVMKTGKDLVPAATPFAPDAVGMGGCINQVPLGNSSITRVGRRLNITAVAIRGTLKAGASGTLNRCVILLIWDRHPNGAAALPAVNTVLNNQNPESLTNKDFAPRFKILRRWDYTLGGGTALAANNDINSIQHLDEFVKLKNKVTIWNAADSTGVVTDMIEGSLLVYAIADVVDGAVAPTFAFNTRVYFQDS